jgi:DNA-binding Lrp family transcriptional regulator
MEIGFVLIRILPTYEKRVYKKLKKLNEISDITPIFGDYDFILKIKMNSYKDLGRIIIDKIRTIDGIKKTHTLSGTKL